MLSYQVMEWGAPLEPREVPTPDPKGTEVLVRIAACGVCHSDLHIWDGYFDLGGGKRATMSDRGVHPPFTMGHEIVGEVAALGPEAGGVEVGARRVVFPWIGCRACAV
ncbi:MAG: alcohol dehydrogenase catalytic domain-containing protein, partial [Alphaproteobacteria bacterium]